AKNQPLFSLSSISADLSLPLSLIFSSQPFSHLLHPLFLSSSSLLISHPNEHTQQRRNQTSSSPEDTVAAMPPAPSSSSGSERRHRLVDAAGARGHRRLRILSINAAAICGFAASVICLRRCPPPPVARR
ncbi:hypothetical protein LINPERHAP2_LOCUS24613, partial [Linum perenne]